MNRKIPLLLLIPVLTLSLGACERRAEKESQSEAMSEMKQNSAEAEQPPAQAEELVWVFEGRGNRQCEGGGLSLEESRAKLADSGVEVEESRCATRTDRMYPAVCGAPTGDILMHLIPMDALDAALELGFDPADQIQYQQRGSCPDNDS
ncbi:hypothetical protein [Microbulbifer thermotolerans]|uniref:Uncharacterized protein n=1 Tax=Microbulbifer thermotolerans TaxID=252514 RepID=A0AB35HV75_MICTH|nr:hypothetical protein [Microbulbifer thermotolerans]MCX2778776.1 hypothetical protein [Microbulbifer thermotolerans]MCX2781952.1 hypothetical protein [Microbulbifer thermotolerans]MCX2793662.1 hypothetical protein [Microbulbifer thermotolerans]MCX2800846.1 hypothetical protein [Microbulbifer thermotolerans]MCX2804081.1 hypothetical protein [Microbulbifer thermotolerans]